MSGNTRLAELIGAAFLEAVERAVAAHLQERPAVTAPAPEGLIGTAEASRRAGVAADTVLEWIRAGILPASRPPGTKSWRIKPTDLEAILSERRGVGPVEPVRLDAARAARAAHLIGPRGGNGGR